MSGVHRSGFQRNLVFYSTLVLILYSTLILHKVTNAGVRSISEGCHLLEFLDLTNIKRSVTSSEASNAHAPPPRSHTK